MCVDCVLASPRITQVDPGESLKLILANRMFCRNRPTICSHQARTHSLLIDIVPSCYTVWAHMALDCFSRGCENTKTGYPFGVMTVWFPGGSKPLWRTLPLSGEFIWCQSDYDDYACLRGEVAMLDSDMIDSSTRVPTARRAWAHMGTCGSVLSNLVLNGLASRGSWL
jgi:hypothetical protein